MTKKLILMKAKMLGTVVDAGSNIIHVDPDNKGEKGRYTDPIVDEQAAKALEMGGFAERVKGSDEELAKKIALRQAGIADDATLVDAGTEAARVEENADAENSTDLLATNLSTRDSVNFPPAQNVRGDIVGTADESDEDAPPAPTRTPRAPKATAAAD